jgi:hypothetical protein
MEFLAATCSFPGGAPSTRRRSLVAQAAQIDALTASVQLRLDAHTIWSID